MTIRDFKFNILSVSTAHCKHSDFIHIYISGLTPGDSLQSTPGFFGVLPVSWKPMNCLRQLLCGSPYDAYQVLFLLFSGDFKIELL